MIVEINNKHNPNTKLLSSLIRRERYDRRYDRRYDVSHRFSISSYLLIDNLYGYESHLS